MKLIKDILEVSNWIIDITKVLKFVLIYIKLSFNFNVKIKYWALRTATASKLAIMFLMRTKCSQYYMEVLSQVSQCVNTG